MSSIKKLAGQTMWYGVSSIAAKFINYLLTPYLTYTLAKTSDYGKMGLIYAAISFLSIIFTYGFETTYFRFSLRKEYKSSLYNTAALSLIFSTLLFTILLWLVRDPFADIIGLKDVPTIAYIGIFIIAFDSLGAIPFDKLRLEERPRKYALIKVGGIVINIFFVWFFIGYCPSQIASNSNSFVLLFYNSHTNPIVYVLIANLIQSVFTLLLLSKEVSMIKWQFNFTLWKQMIIYALPLVIVGMGGMINETFDRLMLRWWLPVSPIYADQQVGIYNACYKLAILITLFVAAFKLGAEPFFFKQAEEQNPQKVYARVMKFFVIIVTIMFLLVSMYLPIWKHFIGPKYWAGLRVVPILLLANIFLGIYYNLAIWYKLTQKTLSGAYITMIGATITVIFNYIFIPRYGYMACAWTTFLCYFIMMILCYIWGQKVYRIPYALKKLCAYIVIVVLLFFIHEGIVHFFKGNLTNFISATLLLVLYVWFVLNIEWKEFQRLPVIGKYFKSGNIVVRNR
ncbi:MAG TPA: polysaccharide biosynthesis C-terminal domain-containing protein [Hanamia sp.]|nr:polysaccharide biosynthesis C-terminal domain-containing protein [Hanamia sp.]